MQPAQDNDGQYEEMDLTPSEDDDDATLHRKLVAAKIARKRAEEDLKLLCNRIGLLKQEEGKVSHNTLDTSNSVFVCNKPTHAKLKRIGHLRP